MCLRIIYNDKNWAARSNTAALTMFDQMLQYVVNMMIHNLKEDRLHVANSKEAHLDC